MVAATSGRALAGSLVRALSNASNGRLNAGTSSVARALSAAMNRVAPSENIVAWKTSVSAA